MQFLIKTDLLGVIDLVTLEAVTGGDDLLIDEAEGRSIEEMNSYLNVRYDITKIFDINLVKNKLVMMYLGDILLYHLHSRISPDNIPELRENRYTNAKDWLEKVADGFITPVLPAKPEDENIPLRHGSSGPKQNHYY